MNIFLFLKYSTVFFSMELLVGYLKKTTSLILTNGGGLTHLSMCAKKSLFASILSCIPIQGTSFYIVVFGIDYDHFSLNICYEYFPVSQIFYSIFLYGIIGWVFKKNNKLDINKWGGA